MAHIAGPPGATGIAPFDPLVVGPVALASTIYLRGWLQLHRRWPRRFGPWRLVAFLGGIAALLVALESPLHALGGRLLQAHMAQHLLLMMVTPPLVWLGAPLLPMLHGLPRRVARRRVGPILSRPSVVRIGRLVTHPAAAWTGFVAITWAWHAPALYERALTSDLWHHAQHLCFLGAALAFWWPVVQPWPSRAPWPRWAVVPYLLLAEVQNTALSAWVAFTGRVLYPSYETVPRPWGISALDDQSAAGAIMWVLGTVAFLLPMVMLVERMLSPQQGRTAAVPTPASTGRGAG